VGQQPETGLVFYPGGKVDYRAYAPYARAVATQGYLVVIARMPLNLAVFDSGEAGEVIKDYPQIKYWVVGGHSLGGSMAAHYTFQHPGRVQGLVLLASYPAGSDNLAHSGVKVLSIFGTNDWLATGLKIDAARPLLPADTRYVAIQGGNHAQFGNYGVQSGDHTATISREEQQQQAVDATINLLQSFAEQ
jgi:pimeloyl-ACP methyl ester carboxylesterase